MLSNFNIKKKMFNLHKRHITKELEKTKNNFLSDNHTIDFFLSVAAIIFLLVTILAMFIICKHTKLKSLVTSLVLQQIRKVGAVTK